MDRKRRIEIADEEEANEEARLQNQVREEEERKYGHEGAMLRRIRQKTHSNEEVAAAAASSSSSSSSMQFEQSVAAAPASRPQIYSRYGVNNLLVNLYSRSMMRYLSPQRLKSLLIADRVKSLQLSKLKQIKCAHTQSVNDLDLDRTESRYLLSCGGDGMIALYDVANEINKRGYTSKPLQHSKRQAREFAVSCVQWYPFDNGMFVSGSFDGSVSVWDTNTFTTAHTFKLGSVVHAAKMSPVATTHSLIATGTATANIRLCDMTSGATSTTLLGHTSEVLSLSWSPTNEFHLVSGSADHTLRVWDIRRAGAFMLLDQYNQVSPLVNTKYINVDENRSKRDVTAHDAAITCISWMNDGMNIMSSGADKKMRLWDARTGKNSLLNYSGLSAASGRINRFSVSCNNASMYVPNHLLLHEYDIWTGKLLHKFKGHFERILCSTQNPQTQDVYTSGMDRTILVWTPSADERSYEADELAQRGEDALLRRQEMEAQKADDQEAQLRVLRTLAPPSAASSSGQRADEDAWSDDE